MHLCLFVQITSTAGGGTLSLEFGVLSRLTNDPVFEQVAKNAVRGLWARRSNLDLVGAHINVFTGEWTQKVTKNGFCICQKNYGLMNFASTN
jgi:hypothetical protein